MPLVTPLANVDDVGRRVGQWQAANHSPVRPKAVIVSSNTSRASWRSHTRRNSAMYPGGARWPRRGSRDRFDHDRGGVGRAAAQQRTSSSRAAQAASSAGARRRRMSPFGTGATGCLSSTGS